MLPDKLIKLLYKFLLAVDRHVTCEVDVEGPLKEQALTGVLLRHMRVEGIRPG
jgi:hypothetical protein